MKSAQNSLSKRRKINTDFAGLQNEDDSLEVPEEVKELTNVNYRNVLPSNLRYGNKNVMPLIPQNLDNSFNNNDKAMLRHLLENTSYTLAQSKQKNTEMTNLAYGLLCEDEAAFNSRMEKTRMPDSAEVEK